MAQNQKAGILAYKPVYFVLSTDRLIMLSFEKSILNVNNSFPGLLIAGTFEKQVPVLLQAAYIWISSVLLFIPIQYNCRIECEFIRLCFFLRYCY